METKDILVLEDDSTLINMFSSFFQFMGIKFDGFTNAEEALEVLNYVNFKVMLIDIGLGNNQMSGIDFCVKVRKTNNISRIYALTGYTSLFEKISPKVAGFNGVFFKPIKYQELLSTLKKDIKNVEFKN